MRIVILAVLTALLIALAFWGHTYWHYGLDVSVALVSLIGAAAGVVALFGSKPRSTCHIADPYLTIASVKDGEYLKVEFDARLVNSGDRLDVLQKAKFLFYHKFGIVIGLGLIFGTREIQAEMGQIIPSPIAPGKTYVVHASDHFSSDSPRGKFVQAWTYEDFVLRCKFIFEHSRSITLRIRPYGRGSPGRFRAFYTELLVRFRR